MKQLIVLIIFLISVPVSAETIVPSSRVSSYLNIREQANVQREVAPIVRTGWRHKQGGKPLG